MLKEKRRVVTTRDEKRANVPEEGKNPRLRWPHEQANGDGGVEGLEGRIAADSSGCEVS